MDFIGSTIPDIQSWPNTYYSPIYKWILTLGMNGVFYAVIGGIIQSIISSPEKNKLPEK